MGDGTVVSEKGSGFGAEIAGFRAVVLKLKVRIHLPPGASPVRTLLPPPATAAYPVGKRSNPVRSFWLRRVRLLYSNDRRPLAPSASLWVHRAFPELKADCCRGGWRVLRGTTRRRKAHRATCRGGDVVKFSGEEDFQLWTAALAAGPDADALSAMRVVVSDLCRARIATGGKTGLLSRLSDQYSGRMPGVVEETIATLNAGGVPIVLGPAWTGSRGVLQYPAAVGCSSV
jgi:SLOG cluster2